MPPFAFDRLLSRFKSFWLIPIVLIFFVSALTSLSQLKRSIEILDERYGTSVWSLFQLKTELRRFHDSLTLYGLDNSKHDEIVERFDILWSRFPILLEGEDARQLKKIPQANELVIEAYSKIQSIEHTVLQELKTTPHLYTQIQLELVPYLRAVDKLTLDNYHFNNDFYNRGDKRVSSLQRQLIWLMLGLIVSGALLLIMVIRESKINRYQAEHDSLTNMPNRSYLRKMLTALCNKNTPFALHLIDLNGFKDINDTLGHLTGDQLLQAVSQRLLENIDAPFGCMTCRMGGDEFAILHNKYIDADSLKQVSAQIITSLEEEFSVDGHSCFIGGSVGSVIYPDHGLDASRLLTHADIAMYKAKENSPSSTQITFDFEMIASINRRNQLQKDLREALENNKLQLAYQPIITLTDHSVSYFEALLRWEHPLYGNLSPLEIIEVAEQYGLAQQLGSWVIDQASQQIHLWKQSGLPLVPIAINISPAMYRLDLASIINNTLHKYNLPPGTLCIEVTEDTTMQNIQEAQIVLSKLVENQVSIALDDFGTGLSSLSHLQQMSVQTLKIDRSFIFDITTNPTSNALVNNIIGIGHDLGMKVVAEGIESQEAADILQNYHCDLGQGYLFSKPLTAEDAFNFFKNKSTDR